MPDLSQPSEVTGLKRAFFEISIAISAKQALDEMQQAIISHAARAMSLRVVLELGSFAHGGKLNS